MNLILKPRSSFWLTRFFNIFGAKLMWTTIGKTIYYPDHIKNPYVYTDVIEHEKVHLEQYKKYGTFGFLFLYAFVFFPVLGAYFRWKFEREAYLVQMKLSPVYKSSNKENIAFLINEIVDTLWFRYGFVWPKPLMRKWFTKQLLK